jgi:uncharacterized protein YutD
VIFPIVIDVLRLKGCFLDERKEKCEIENVGKLEDRKDLYFFNVCLVGLKYIKAYS